MLILQAEVIGGSREDVQGYGLLLVHGQVPAVQVEAHGGCQRGAAEGLVQLQHTQPQCGQPGQDRHLQQRRGLSQPSPGSCWQRPSAVLPRPLLKGVVGGSRAVGACVGMWDTCCQR